MELSRLITTKTDLRRLGIEDLKLPASRVESALADNPGKIHMAAWSLLMTWREMYEDPVEAFNDLFTALKKCHMNILASKLLESVGIFDQGK